MINTLQRLDFRGWIYSLLSALIGGGASSVTASFTASMLAPGQFNLANPSLLLQMMAWTFVINGALSVFLFLKQSPLPPVVGDEHDSPAAGR